LYELAVDPTAMPSQISHVESFSHQTQAACRLRRFAALRAEKSRSFSLIDCISVGVDRMQRNFEPMRKQVDAWQRSELTDVTATRQIAEQPHLSAKTIEAFQAILRRRCRFAALANSYSAQFNGP
jgi:hypothetical protein